jgi:hypothetical protein
MEEEIKKIVDTHAENVAVLRSKRDKLLSRIEFCQIHNFKEEERIARLEFDSIDMIIYRYGNMVTDIQEVLDKWN